MAFAGGSADKVGHEYELWWTLRRLTQLLRGEVQAISVEPLSGDGAELWVEADGVRTYDQVKYRSYGTWTPSRLRSEGVLTKLGPQYAAGSRVLLVLSQPSEELEQLIRLAITTSSARELWDTAPNPAGLDHLREAWGVSEDQTRNYLSRTSVRHDGLPHLKEFVELAFETLILGSPLDAVGALRQFLDDHINTTFSAPQVWTALEAAGLSARPRLDPGPTVARLQASLDRYLRAVRRTAPSGGTVERREVGEVFESVAETTAPVVLVVGKAGTGKSVVAAEAADKLARSGRHVAALRLDRLHPAASTAAQLGQAMDLERSPVLALSEVSPQGFDGILIVDQLDAVSSYSGRMPAVFDAVDDALNQARLLGNVRVVLVVRSIDLKEDPRLRRLAGESVPTVEVGELDPGDTRKYLESMGANPSELREQTVQLLRLPIHLYLFSELEPELRVKPYTTLTSLYAAFVRSFRSRLELAGHHDQWPELSRLLVERMNSDEALAVPMSALEHIRPLYLEALISAGVLVEEDSRLALFHETFFDYLFAKSFVLRGTDLVQWFVASGQGLFRRSQLRQLLAFIATEDRNSLIDQVLCVAESSLRPHLSSIAYSILEDFSPKPDDWVELRRLLTPTNPFAKRVLSLIGTRRWFVAADATGDIERILDDPLWNESASGQVARLAAELPDRVLELLTPRRDLGSPWIEALRTAVSVSTSPQWAQYALEQAKVGGLNLPGHPFDVLRTPLFHRLVSSHPLEALRLFASSLAWEVEAAIAEHESSLDTVLSRHGRNSVDASDIDQLARSFAQDFVAEMIHIVEMIATYHPPQGAAMWQYRLAGRHRGLDDDLYFAFDIALSKFTSEAQSQAFPQLQRLSSHQVSSLDFLVCRAMHEVDPDHAVAWLLESESHRKVGWLSDPRWESRRLIECASRSCSDDKFSALESALLTRERQDRGREGLRWNGLAELELLSALDKERLSDLAAQRVAELRRKFAYWTPTEPQGISGGIVQSPIRPAAAERMKDVHWLRAIEKYADREQPVFRDDSVFGGTDQLASLMGTLAKGDPSRFIELGLKLPANASSGYTENILRSVAGEVDQREVVQLVRKFRADHPNDSGRGAVAVISAYAGELEDELFGELLLLANDADPETELARTETKSGYLFGGDLVTAGINSTRGSAASTLARVIFADHSRLAAALPALRHLVKDPIIAVRTLACELALAYAAIERESGLDVLSEVLDDEDVLTTSPALRALRWSMLWNADRFAPFLVRALGAEDAQEAGALWANCAVNDALGSAPRDIADLSESARMGAADAIAPNPKIAPSLLASLLDDASSDVRDRAAHCIHYLKDLDPEARDQLVGSFVNSLAFEDALDDVLDALESLPSELPGATTEICERAIEALEGSPSSVVGGISSNLIAVLVRLYRTSREEEREATLDLIDRTVLLQLWRVDEALDEAR